MDKTEHSHNTKPNCSIQITSTLHATSKSIFITIPAMAAMALAPVAAASRWADAVATPCDESCILMLLGQILWPRSSATGLCPPSAPAATQQRRRTEEETDWILRPRSSAAGPRWIGAAGPRSGPESKEVGEWIVAAGPRSGHESMDADERCEVDDDDDRICSSTDDYYGGTTGPWLQHSSEQMSESSPLGKTTATQLPNTHYPTRLPTNSTFNPIPM